MRFPAFSVAIRGFDRTTRTTPRSAPALHCGSALLFPLIIFLDFSAPNGFLIEFWLLIVPYLRIRFRYYPSQFGTNNNKNNSTKIGTIPKKFSCVKKMQRSCTNFAVAVVSNSIQLNAAEMRLLIHTSHLCRT